jgi:hypothetical protein
LFKAIASFLRTTGKPLPHRIRTIGSRFEPAQEV